MNYFNWFANQTDERAATDNDENLSNNATQPSRSPSHLTPVSSSAFTRLHKLSHSLRSKGWDRRKGYGQINCLLMVSHREKRNKTYQTLSWETFIIIKTSTRNLKYNWWLWTAERGTFTQIGASQFQCEAQVLASLELTTVLSKPHFQFLLPSYFVLFFPAAVRLINKRARKQSFTCQSYSDYYA